MKDKRNRWLREFILWLRALWLSGFGRLDRAAEAMYWLNVYARQVGRDSRRRKEAIYKLKNRLVRVLYEQGYCLGVSKKLQRLKCWGTWEYDCDQFCPKCGGTGIYREYILYEFRFLINGQAYTWHQPESMVDWPVKLNPQPWDSYEFTSIPDKELPDDLDLKTLFFIVWWALKRHGRAPRLSLFRPFRFWIYRSKGFYGNPGDAYGLLVRVRWRDNYWSILWPAVPNWSLFGIPETLWCPEWLFISRLSGSWHIVLFGWSMVVSLRNARARLACFLHGHEWSEHYPFCKRCWIQHPAAKEMEQ